MEHMFNMVGLSKREQRADTDPCDIIVVGVEFVSLEVNSASETAAAPMHNEISDVDEHQSSNATSRNIATSVPPTLKILDGDLVLAQVIQTLSICVSFGVVFPPLCLLGTLAIILHSLFEQYSLSRFAGSLPSPSPTHGLSESTMPSTSDAESTVSATGVTAINGIPVSEIRKTLDAECRHFSSALWHCSPIPFVASFPVLAFFLWEIVSVSYPNAVGYTIILPVSFLFVAFVCWQLLFRVRLFEKFRCPNLVTGLVV